MALAEVEARTLADMRRFLRDLSTAERKETRRLAALHKDLAADLASDAQGRARSLGGVAAKAAPAIVGKGTQSYASIGLGKPGRYPMAGVAFWGARARTGWNAGNRDSRPQHPRWVGNSWEPGGPGGPRAINDGLRAERNAIGDRYLDLFAALARDVGFT